MDTVQSFREERLHAAMERHAANVLVASSADCIAYLSGYDPFVPRFSSTAQMYCVYGPETGKRVLVCGVADAANGVEAQAFDDIFTVGEFYFHIPDPSSAFGGGVQRALENRFDSMECAVSAAVGMVCKGPAQAPNQAFDRGAVRVAVEECRASVAVWKRLEADYGESNVLQGGAILLEAKCVKHPKEQEMLAASVRIADEAFFEMVESITTGVSEADLYERYCRACLSRHAWPYFCVATCDERSAYVDTASMPAQIVREGSVLRFDFGCRLGVYYSDIGRVAVIGRNEKAEEYYRWAREGVEEGIRAARPGVTAGEVFEAMVRTVRKGISHYQRNHTGHGIGLTMYDAPSIAPGNDMLLQAGMVLCLETPYYEIGWGGVMLEETILIREGETVCLSGGPRDILRLQP